MLRVSVKALWGQEAERLRGTGLRVYEAQGLQGSKIRRLRS